MAMSTLRQAAVAVLIVVLPGTAAHALNVKSWVANFGNDGNDCSLVHPCATFQRAHDQTNPGGEIGVLTPGDYGGSGAPELPIVKSITVTNDGAGEASILSPDHLRIANQAGAGDIVSLRGLLIDGQGAAGAGIVFVQGSASHIQKCVIRNFEGVGFDGIVFAPVGNSQLFVSDTIIFNNGSDGGVAVTNEKGGSARAVLDRVHLENNTNGLVIRGSFAAGVGPHVIVRDSVISGNAANGILAFTQAGRASAFAIVERTTIVNNRQNGILADGPGATLL